MKRRGDVRGVLRLAWPSALSYLLGNAYRINDEYWLQGFGREMQAAFTAILFVAMMNFALIFLAAPGTLSLVARATGAGDVQGRERVIGQALWLVLMIWLAFALLGPLSTPTIVAWLGLDGQSAAYATEYLDTLYVVSLPLVLAPVLDHALIAIGNTLVPSLLELLAVALNYFLAPILIYGVHAAERVDHPGAQLAANVAGWFGAEGLGVRGAPLAIAVSRLFACVLGLLALRFLFSVRWYRVLWPDPARWRALLSISLPVSLSIGLYSAVYWALLRTVMSDLGPDAMAALGIGFSCFEGVCYPLYLGVAMAGAGVAGRALGAGDPAAAWEAVRSVRRIALVLGLCVMVAFWIVAPIGAPWFSHHPGVIAETIGYVQIISFAQPFVALEAANERILIGAGFTRWPMVASMLGNGLRLPIAWLFAVVFGWESLGVWWALDLTSALKAWMQTWLVQQRAWLKSGLERP